MSTSRDVELLVSLYARVYNVSRKDARKFLQDKPEQYFEKELMSITSFKEQYTREDYRDAYNSMFMEKPLTRTLILFFGLNCFLTHSTVQ